MKTVTFYADGSIQETALADVLIARGEARYSTPEEVRSYNRSFERDDEQIESLTAGQRMTRAYLTPGGCICDNEP